MFLKFLLAVSFVMSPLDWKPSQSNLPALCRDNFKMHFSSEQSNHFLLLCKSPFQIIAFGHFPKMTVRTLLTIFLLPLLCSLPPSLDVAAGHPPSGLRPNQTKPHIFSPKSLVSRSPKRLDRLRRQGAANNSQAITFKLSHTIKRPTVLCFLQSKMFRKLNF